MEKPDFIKDVLPLKDKLYRLALRITENEEDAQDIVQETMIKACRILEDLRCPFVLNQNAYNILNRTIERNGLKQAALEKGKMKYKEISKYPLTTSKCYVKF